MVDVPLDDSGAGGQQMVDDISGRLAALGFDVPGPESVPLAANVPAVGFASEGDDALTWWRRFRAVHEGTGWWPVLVPPLEGAVYPFGLVGGQPAGRVAKAAELDAGALLNPRGTFESLPDEVRQDMLARWPDVPYRIERFGLPYRPDGRPARTLIALVEAPQGWQVPALLDYGGWDSCPESAVHSAVLRYWNQRWGAELVCVAPLGPLELAMTRPPHTRLEALAFAWEYAAYCLDGMGSYEADDIPDLGGCLIDAELVRFWWD